jgi:hypothetical protein
MDFSDSLKLSEKLRSVSFSKLDKYDDNQTTVGEKIFYEISEIFRHIDKTKSINYLGAQTLGDQLAVAIKEIKKSNLAIEPIEQNLLKINSLI